MDTQNIKTRPDGSIDIDFYTKRARVLRSQQAHKLIRKKQRKAGPAPRFLSNIFGALKYRAVSQS